MMNKAGRRITLAGSLMISGLTCLSTGLVPDGKFQDPRKNQLIFNQLYIQTSKMVGKYQLVHLWSVVLLLLISVYHFNLVRSIISWKFRIPSKSQLTDVIGFQIQRLFKWFVFFSVSFSLRWLSTPFAPSQPNCSLRSAEPSSSVFTSPFQPSWSQKFEQVFCIHINFPCWGWRLIFI